MELVAVLRVLWRRRVMVALGGFAALAVALMAGNGTPDTGIAAARVVVDTPVSQLSHAAPEGADSLTVRAIMLGNLLATDRVRADIARRADLPPSQLAVVSASSMAPAIPTRLADRATEVAATRPERYKLVVHIDEVLPVVSIEALAPGRGDAVSLVDAATSALESVAAPDSQRVVVEALGPTQAGVIAGSSGRAKALAMSIAVFALWCGCVVFGSALLRRRRARAAAGLRLA